MKKDSSNYYTSIIGHAHKFAKMGLQGIRFHKNLFGTVFKIYRLKEGSKEKVAYGSTYLQSTIFSTPKKDSIEYDKSSLEYIGECTLIAPMSELRDFYSLQSMGSIEVIDDGSGLERGDELTTKIQGKLLVFKVESKETYGEFQDTISKYLLTFIKSISDR